MTEYKRVGPETLIDDDREYVVMATYKDEPTVKPFVRFRGTYDEAADYAQRNESPDNVESYYVAEPREQEAEIKVGDVLTLPFFAGEPASEHDLQFEVEEIVEHGTLGTPEARLIMLKNGKREKTSQGHFRRLGRALEEIRADLAARHA